MVEWLIFIGFIIAFYHVIKTGDHIPVISPLIGIFFVVLAIATAPLIFPLFIFLPLGLDFLLQEGDKEKRPPDPNTYPPPRQSPTHAFHYGRPTPRDRRFY